MSKVVVLGTANSVPDERHENTHLAVVTHLRTILVDCVGNPIVRLNKAGIELESISELILTHFHPDHVSGLPLLLMDLWLLGRKTPMSIYGLAPTLECAASMMRIFEWDTWPGFFPVTFIPLPQIELASLLEGEDLRVYSSPVCHLVPTIGLRFEFLPERQVLAYSSDTSPCAAVTRLAKNANVLIHEATGLAEGHSSPAQAGEVAQQAGAGQLALIHYRVREADPARMLAEARQTFSGQVCVAEDFQVFEF
jgi:ribonuclease Z